MKKCRLCGELKDLTDFGVHGRRKDGRQSECKACKKAVNHEYYLANPRREERSEGGKRLKRKNQTIIYEYLTSHPCVDCGLDDWRVLDFDHIGSDKTAHVSKLMGGSTEKMVAEIKKCEIRCRNCHAIKTYERADSWRYTYMPL